MICTVSISLANAQAYIQVPTYLPLGYILSISMSMYNIGVTYNAQGFVLPLLCILSIDIGYGNNCYPLYFFSSATLNTQCTFIYGGNSSFAALHLVIFSTF